MNRGSLILIVIFLAVCIIPFSYVPAKAKPSDDSFKDNFKGTIIDNTKWKVNLGYAGSSITQDDFLLINDKSMFPTRSSLTSLSEFRFMTVHVSFCMYSPASFWAEVQVILSDSTTNQFGENIQEIFIRKGNLQFIDGAWYPIEGTTPDSLCIFYQSKFLGVWGSEVLLAKNVNANVWYHLKLDYSDSSLDIKITKNDNLIGSYLSTRGPINTDLHVILSTKSQSIDYTLTGAFDNLKIKQLA